MMTKIFKILLIFSAIIFVILFHTKKASAEGSNILINEVFPNSADRTKEFIELRNTTDQDISLVGYTIEDGTAKPQNLDGKNILANGFLVLYGAGKDFSFELNKSGEKVILKNNGLIIGEVDYGTFDGTKEPWPAPATGQSLTRYRTTDSDPVSTDFILAPPSPGIEYYKPIYSNSIIVNEILPEPSDKSNNEFIELYNNGNADIDLSYWMLDDGGGGSSPYLIPSGTTILAQSYLTFYKTQTGISLNDDGDEARLLSPDNEIKSMIKYDKAISGQSYSYFDNDWQWTQAITPDALNILLSPTNAQIIPENISFSSIEQVKQNPIGTQVVISGTVTVLPDTLSSQYFYIQDSTGGIQIYSYYKNFPMLGLGDVVQVSGELSESNNEERIKIIDQTDITVISKVLPIQPKNINVGDIGENFDGQFIQITGKILETSWSEFVVTDSENHQIKIVIQSMTKIKKPKMHQGDTVEISGIVSQYKNEYRLLPIEQNDVKIITYAKLPTAGLNQIIYLIFPILILSIWNIFQKAKKRLTRLPKKLPKAPNWATFLH